MCPIINHSQRTHPLKQHCRKSAYQALHAAFAHVEPTAIHGINQKVVLCYSSVFLNCLEKAELHTTRGSKGLDQLKEITLQEEN